MFCSMEKLPPEAYNFGFAEKVFYRYTLKKLEDPLFTEVDGLEKFNETIMQSEHADFVEEIRNFVVYPDDIWVITYPKCGTTWTQEAVWQIFNGVDVDNGGAVDIGKRFPFLEWASIWQGEDEPRLRKVQKMKRPRLIKSHLPIAFLPVQLWTVKPKIVLVTREAKDTAISFYHHYVHLLKYNGTKEEFLELFLQGKVMYGSYWDYLEQFHMVQAKYPNIKAIKYEELKHNMSEVLKDLCTFLDKPLSAEKLNKLEHHLQFSSMKDNPAINFDPNEQDTTDPNYKTADGAFTFIRRGETGAYKDEMSPEFIKIFDQVTNDRFKHINLYQNENVD